MSFEGIRFEATISLGAIVQLVVFIGAMARAYYTLNRKLDRLSMQHSMIWKWFKTEHGINGGSDGESC